MFQRDKNTASPVDQFRMGGHFYEHVIFCADDDRVELRDAFTKEVLLTFDSHGYVWDAQKVFYGKWSMYGDMSWQFTPAKGEVARYGKDLLAAEVEISKLFLAQQQ